jgi:hypothetical protein
MGPASEKQDIVADPQFFIRPGINQAGLIALNSDDARAGSGAQREFSNHFTDGAGVFGNTNSPQLGPT